MFNQDDEYINATKDAQIYSSKVSDKRDRGFIILNFLLLIFLLYTLFYYIDNNSNIFSKSKQAVLGVSEIVDDSALSNERLMEILKETEVDSVEEEKVDYLHSELQNSMKVLIGDSSIKSKSSYTEAIARELDDKRGFKGKVVVVKKGDTLSSLSERYYGNSMEFSKIIEANSFINSKDDILKVGQKIKIPY